MAACLDGGRGGVALFGDGAEEIGREAERVERQAGSCVDPVASTAPGSRRLVPIAGADRAHGREAARSIPEIGGAPVRPPVRRRPRPADLVGVAGAPDRAILGRRPPSKADPTDRHNRRPPPPRQDPCHLVGSSHSTAPGSAHPVPSPGTVAHRRVPRDARPRDRAPLPSAAPPTVIAPPRGVPAERRQETCRCPDKRRPAGVLRTSSALRPGHRTCTRGTRRHGRQPMPGDGGGDKVVVIVGPVGSSTAKYISHARRTQSQAASVRRHRHRDLQPQCHVGRGQGRRARAPTSSSTSATATATRARTGPSRRRRRTGWVSTRRPATATTTSSTTASTSSRRTINLAKNAVVILNRLCYAAGNSERGRALPTKYVASTRADYFAGGFLRAGARAVFANGKDSLTSIIRQSADDQPHDRADLHHGPGLLGSCGLPLRLEAHPRLHGLAGSVRGEPLLPLGGRATHDDGLGRPRRDLTPTTNGGPGPDGRPAGAEDSWCDSPGCSPGEGASRFEPAGGVA